MEADLEQILDDCISALQRREDLEACLARYPGWAARLRPLLRTAVQIGDLEPRDAPSAASVAARRRRFLQEAERLRRRERRAGTGWARRAEAVRKEFFAMSTLGRIGVTAATVVVVIALVGGGAALASQGSPREFLGGLAQQVQSFFGQPSTTPQPQEVEFKGTIESIGDGFVVIEGQDGQVVVFLDDNTEIEGTLEVGAWVEVKAIVQEDGTLLAIEIEVEEPPEATEQDEDEDTDEDEDADEQGDEDEDADEQGDEDEDADEQGDEDEDADEQGDEDEDTDEQDDEDEDTDLEGVIQSIGDGFVVIDGQVVFLDDNTEIEGALEVGGWVEIEVVVQEDGRLLAIEIEVEEGDTDIDDEELDDEDDDENDSDDDEDEDQDDDGHHDDDDSHHDDDENDDDDES